MELRTGIVGLAGVALAVTACTPGGSPEPAAIPTPSADATGSLRVWLMKGSQTASVIDAVNEAFQEQYPNVQVDVELQEWPGVQDRLTESLGGDSPPDVVEIGNTLTATYAAAGLLADLTEQADSLGVADMLPGLVPSGELDGARYGIPYFGGVRTVVYRTSDFERANVSVPTSLAQLEEVAAALQESHKDDADYSAFYFPGRFWEGAVPFIWSHGGEIAVQDDSGTWTGSLDSPESVAGLSQLKGLVDAYSKAPRDADQSGNIEAFNTGNVGMMIDSWWAPGALDSGDLKGDVGAFVLPGVEEGSTAPVFFGGQDLAVAARAANPGLAVAWIGVLTGLEAQTLLAREGEVIPNQEGAFAGHQGQPFLAVADRAALNSRFTPVSPNWPTVERAQVLPDMLERIFTGESTVEQATSEASDTIATILNG